MNENKHIIKLIFLAKEKKEDVAIISVPTLLYVGGRTTEPMGEAGKTLTYFILFNNDSLYKRGRFFFRPTHALPKRSPGH